MTEGKALYRRVVEALNSHDLEAVGNCFDPDCEVKTENVTLHGRVQLKAFLGALIDAIPDMTVTIHNMVLEGPLLVVEYTQSGTFTRPFRSQMGEVPPTGRPFVNHVMELNRIEGDQIVSSKLYADRLAQRIQMGLMPEASAVVRGA
jgi:predicted ester cyclase